MKQQISSAKAPKALGPYSAGIATEGLAFLSGQLGADTKGNLVSEDVVGQAKKAFENMQNKQPKEPEQEPSLQMPTEGDTHIPYGGIFENL